MFGWLLSESKLCVCIPIPGLRGRMYVSPMPWGPYDTRGALLRTYKKLRLEHAVMLVTDEEIKKKARRPLLKLYANRRIEVTRFPIADLTKPVYHEVTALVEDLQSRLAAGERLVIHCNAGVGRTGTIAACVVCAAMNMDGDGAIEHIQQYMKIDLVEEQVRFVRAWGSQYGRPDVMTPTPGNSPGTTPVVDLLPDEDVGPVKKRVHQ